MSKAKSWGKVSLPDLCKLQVGKTPSRSNPRYWNGTNPWVTISDLTKKRLKKTSEYISDDAVNECNCKLIPAGTLLMSFKLSIGKLGISEVPLYTNEAIVALPIIDQTRLDQRYLFHSLQSQDFSILGDKAVKGLTLNLDKLNNILIPLPPLTEQKRIAAILDTADSIRQKRKAAIAKLDELAQSVFLEMFGDPSLNNHNYPVSNFGKLFSEKPIFGSMIPPSSEGGSWLSLRVGNIQNWELNLVDKKYIELPKSMIGRHSVRNGDILLARAIASQEHLGKAIIVNPEGRKWAFDSHLMRLRFNLQKVEPMYIRSLLMTEGGRGLFLQSSRRSSVQFNINTKEISQLSVPIPPLELQNEFSNKINHIEHIKVQHKYLLAKEESLFSSLQHRAFAGEL